MTKSKKNLAIVIALITLLVALGSLFATFGIFTKPTKIVEAVETGTYAQLDSIYSFSENYNQTYSGKIRSYKFTNKESDFGSYHVNTPFAKISVGKTYSASNTETGDMYAYFYKNGELYDCFVYAPVETIYAPEDCSHFLGSFYYGDDITGVSYNWSQKNVEEITFSKCFNTSKATNMYQMFSNLPKLKNLDLSMFDTSNVTDMDSMFRCCSALNTLQITNFNTSNVKQMSYMFMACSSLRTLNLSSFDTKSITQMYTMFAGCCFNTLTLGEKFVITSGCRTDNIFTTPETIINAFTQDATKRKEILDMSDPEARLAELFDKDTLDGIKGANDTSFYELYLAMVSDSTINTIVCPQLESGVTVALAPASNHIYAFTDDDKREPVEAITSENWKNEKGEARTLKLYYKDDPQTEVPPISTPDTPSETGIVADISMVIIALASILSLAVVATKKKRLAR